MGEENQQQDKTLTSAIGGFIKNADQTRLDAEAIAKQAAAGELSPELLERVDEVLVKMDAILNSSELHNVVDEATVSLDKFNDTSINEEGTMSSMSVSAIIQRLHKLPPEVVARLKEEAELIDKKQSKLSSATRKKVVEAYKFQQHITRLEKRKESLNDRETEVDSIEQPEQGSIGVTP